MRLKSKVISMVLVIMMFIGSMTNTAFASDNPLNGVLQKGKDTLNSVVDSVKSKLKVSLSDITFHWGKDYINKLIDIGSISGYTDGTFKPDNPVTRAEFTKILLVSMGTDPGVNKDGYWAKNYISEATNKGLIKSGEFSNPDQNITRIEITKMLVRALGKEDVAQKLAGQFTIFKDDNSISSTNKGYVKIANAYGIINGLPDGTFLPNNSATRAEAAKMIVVYLDNKDKTVDLGAIDDNSFMIDGQKVETSHKELIPQIKKLIEIMKSGEGYTEVSYSTTYKQVDIVLYKSLEDISGIPYYMKGPKSLLTINVYLEKDKQLPQYIPYAVSIYNMENSIALDKFKKIVQVLVPTDLQSKVLSEMQKGIENKTYGDEFAVESGNLRIAGGNSTTRDQFDLLVKYKQ